MEGIYGWVSNIVYYLIFITMLMNLLPSGKYEKYLRLFAGCILILLVIQPVTGGLRLEEKITAIFNSLSFENEMGELNTDLADMENKRMTELISRYEDAAAEDISRLAAAAGFKEQKVSVQIEERKEDPDFGKIVQVSVVLSEKDGPDSDAGTQPQALSEKVVSGQASADISRDALIEPVEPVEPVRIGDYGQEDQVPDQSSSHASAPGTAGREDIRRLKQEIAGYYQVEEQYVEVKLENE